MSNYSPVTLIKKNYNSLSTYQKCIADYILTHIESIGGISINALAENCQASATTVTRFLNKLGYQSFPDFKMDLIRELSSTENTGNQENSIYVIEDGYQNIKADSTINEIIRAVTSSASRTIHDMGQMVYQADIETAVNYLCQAKCIVFYGAGGSSPIAMDGYHKFLRLGMPVFYDPNSHLSMIRIAHMAPNDVLILISHTGESREVLQCSKLAKEIGCKVIGITSYVNSSLAKLSDVVLHSASYDASNYTDALVSRLVQLTLLDILFVTITLRHEPESKHQIQISRKAIASEKKQRAKPY